MVITDFVSFFEKKVIVKLKDGATFVGIFTGAINDFDSSSGKDEIELYIDKDFVVLEIPEIDTISEVHDG